MFLFEKEFKLYEHKFLDIDGGFNWRRIGLGVVFGWTPKSQDHYGFDVEIHLPFMWFNAMYYNHRGAAAGGTNAHFQ